MVYLVRCQSLKGFDFTPETTNLTVFSVNLLAQVVTKCKHGVVKLSFYVSLTW